MIVCRIQDFEGRGPYKPGFSHMWSERETGALPVHIAFPEAMAVAREKVRTEGGAVGCAFRSVEQARKWFSDNEVLTLLMSGYSLVWVKADEIIAENEDQLVIWTKNPLRESVLGMGWRKPA